MAKVSKKGIVTGVVALAAVGAILSPDKKEIETITLTVPNYQIEYDINTDIPVEISVVPEDADTKSLKYISSGESLTFSSTSINTGNIEGTYEIHVSSDTAESVPVSINVVDISARNAKAEEERLAKEKAEQEAESKRLEEELAAKDEELKRLSEELEAQEAETQKSSEELALKNKETEKNTTEPIKENVATSPPAETQTANESQATIPEPEPAVQTTATTNETAPQSASGGGESNFNTYDNTSQQQTEASYVLNTSTKKIHHPSCSSVKKIAPQNYSTSNSTVDELISQGYSTCGNCFK